MGLLGFFDLPDSGRPMRSDDLPPCRFWTAPDGSRWRVVLQAPARHQLRQGETRPILTFVDLGSVRRQITRRVPENTVLEELSGEELVTLLDEAR